MATTLYAGENVDDNSPFLKLEQPCDEAVSWLIDRLLQEGLLVMRTFDLQSARQAQVLCPCPHHGTERCDCQMVVLLIYFSDKRPISLIAHGYNHQTWFTVVDTPQQRVDPRLEATIRNIVSSPLLPPVNVENNAHMINPDGR